MVETAVRWHALLSNINIYIASNQGEVKGKTRLTCFPFLHSKLK